MISKYKYKHDAQASESPVPIVDVPIADIPVRRVCIRRVCLLIGIIFSISQGCLFAQQAGVDQRFKHEKHGGVVYASSEDYELKCDIYQPVAETPRPVMLVIHGGAWTTGSKFAMLRHARILANRGYLAMAIQYRLAPKHKWPAQIHDCKHAVRWIREHAGQYNADPDRVYVFGYSAGGHLGSLLATTDEEDGLEGDPLAPYDQHSTRVQGLIAGGAPMEFSWIPENSGALKHWLQGTRAEIPEKYSQASPVTYVTADDPVAVLFHGDADLLVPTSSPQEFLARYQEKELSAVLVNSGGGHGTTFTQTSVFLDCLGKLEGFLAKERTVEKMNTILGWASESQGSGSASLDRLVEFAIKEKGFSKEQAEQTLINERDGKRFLLKRSATEFAVEEAIGVEEEKLIEKRSIEVRREQ